MSSSSDIMSDSLKKIRNLQDVEKKLYDKLGKQTNSIENSSNIKSIVDEINDLSKIRIDNYRMLTDLHSIKQENVADTRANLVDELTIVGLIEDQLNNAKKELNAITNEKNNKMRMVEINTYYGKRYKAHSSLMKLIIMVFIPILILAILAKKELIPSNISKILSILIGLIGSVLIILNIYDLSSRDNMEYDEYDWGVRDPKVIHPTVYEYNKREFNILTNNIDEKVQSWKDSIADDIGNVCSGPACCSNKMKYNKATNKCVESFENSVQQSNIKPKNYILTTSECSPWDGGNDSVVRPYDKSENESYESV